MMMTMLRMLMLKCSTVQVPAPNRPCANVKAYAMLDVFPKFFPPVTQILQFKMILLRPNAFKGPCAAWMFVTRNAWGLAALSSVATMKNPNSNRCPPIFLSNLLL